MSFLSTAAHPFLSVYKWNLSVDQMIHLWVDDDENNTSRIVTQLKLQLFNYDKWRWRQNVLRWESW